MVEVILLRDYHMNGTNGTLHFQGEVLCKTIELPWHDNARRISCIPEGRYLLTKRYSDKFKWHLWVKNVPNRDLILLHPANNAQRELSGCIAPVTRCTGEGSGILSRKAMAKVTALLFPYLERNIEITLIIKKRDHAENNRSL